MCRNIRYLSEEVQAKYNEQIKEINKVTGLDLSKGYNKLTMNDFIKLSAFFSAKYGQAMEKEFRKWLHMRKGLYNRSVSDVKLEDESYSIELVDISDWIQNYMKLHDTLKFNVIRGEEAKEILAELEKEPSEKTRINGEKLKAYFNTLK